MRKSKMKDQCKSEAKRSKEEEDAPSKWVCQDIRKRKKERKERKKRKKERKERERKQL